MEGDQDRLTVTQRRLDLRLCRRLGRVTGTEAAEHPTRRRSFAVPASTGR
jgi:hypothetical protein